MPEPAEHDTSTGPATATLEPPAPPGTPPRTATATGGPGPKRRRRWLPWLVAVLVVAAIAAAVVGVLALANRGHSAQSPAASASAFDSAMKKAGVTANLATKPVELTSVEASGSHPFEADFTAEELTALVNAFHYSTTVDGQQLSVSSATIRIPGDGTMSLAGTIDLNGNSYSGSIAGPVSFENGQITSSGATDVQAEGIPVGGAQAQQATALLLGYVNEYLAAAPGLKVESAALTGAAVHVKGTAPDSISGR